MKNSLSGFTCCNKDLEEAMKTAMSGNDLLASADSIQKMAETTLGGKFETVVALDDFAYKSHFKDGKTCKIEKDGQVTLLILTRITLTLTVRSRLATLNMVFLRLLLPDQS